MISTNRRMRTRMSGGVGAGGEKPPATRLSLPPSFRESEHPPRQKQVVSILTVYCLDDSASLVMCLVKSQF